MYKKGGELDNSSSSVIYYWAWSESIQNSVPPEVVSKTVNMLTVKLEAIIKAGMNGSGLSYYTSKGAMHYYNGVFISSPAKILVIRTMHKDKGGKNLSLSIDLCYDTKLESLRNVVECLKKGQDSSIQELKEILKAEKFVFRLFIE